MSRFLPNLTTPGKYYTEIENRLKEKKQNKRKNIFSLCATILLRILSLLLFLTIYLLALPYPKYNPDTQNRDNFLLHHIIVNILSMKQVMPKSPFT